MSRRSTGSRSLVSLVSLVPWASRAAGHRRGLRLRAGLTALASLGFLMAGVGAAHASGADPRLVQLTIDGMPTTVLLPPGYGQTSVRYPTLYLLPDVNTPNEYLDNTDLESFSATQRPVIVVMPRPTGQIGYGFLVNSLDGSCHRETQFIDGVIPYIDSHYRTRADRAGRAIAGIAPGGYSTMFFAARYPNLFTAAGSFSGEPDTSIGYDNLGRPFFQGIEEAADNDCGGSPTGPGLWGSQLTDQVLWRNSNPADLAEDLRGMSLFEAVGNDVPCDLQDVEGLPNPTETDVPGLSQAFQVTEEEIYLSSSGFANALAALHIPYTRDFYGCGLHNWRYWQRDMHQFWPQMEAAFGNPAPRTWDYRRADPQFSTWGWTFQADSRRATEFLNLQNVSSNGLTLTGSGTETVTTAADYQPGQRVVVRTGPASSGGKAAGQPGALSASNLTLGPLGGLVATALGQDQSAPAATPAVTGQRTGAVTAAAATTETVTANRDGQITFQVNLGHPHTIQEYTPQNEAENSSAYFVTRSVSLQALGG